MFSIKGSGDAMYISTVTDQQSLNLFRDAVDKSLENFIKAELF